MYKQNLEKNVLSPLIIGKKILNVMRISILFIFIGIFSVTANTYSQDAKVSINSNSITVKEVLSSIKAQTDYSFWVDINEVDVNHVVSIHVKDQTVSSVLDKVFENMNANYVLKGNHIVIYKRSNTSDGFVEYKASSISQQRHKITGKIVDINGEPIIGAYIVIKGSKNNGTISDSEGNFILEVPTNAILQISYVGYTSKEVSIGNNNQILVTLNESHEILDEVVVIGYGTQKRKDFTGSVSSLKVENSPILESPRTSIFDALHGTITGIQMNREGAAGSSSSIEVHGQKSINGGSNPLIVLDGMIYDGRWDDIDPNIVSSIDVLKDATSLSAYGSQAANGVIMITTKKGIKGKPLINFNTSISIGNASQKVKYLSPDLAIKRNLLKQGFAENTDPKAIMTDTEYENWQKGKTTDFIDYVLRTGLTQNYNASISGAGDKISYFTSFTHTGKTSVIKGDQYKREALSLRLQSDITNWLQISAQANYQYSNYDGTPAHWVKLPDYAQPTRPNGQVEKYPLEQGALNINPLWDTECGYIDDYDRVSDIYLKGNILIKCPWINGLTYHFNISRTEENFKHYDFYHEGYYVSEGTGEERYSDESSAKHLILANGTNMFRWNEFYVMDNILDYSNQFGKHFLNVTAVYTRDQKKYDTREIQGTDFSTTGNTLLGYNGLTLANVQQYKVLFTSKKADVGYLIRLNYSYDDKYHFNASVRRDGGSVFGIDKKWGVFPALGIAWTVSKENFMQGIDALNYLKLKASWGKNGNQSLSPYNTLTSINLGQNGGSSVLYDNSGLNGVEWGEYVNSIGNTELGWEATTAYNLGLELGMFNDQIHFDIDIYKSKTTNQIFNRLIPIINNGFDEMKATMGQVNNWGIEMTLNTVNLKTRDFEWTSMINFYLNRNKLIDLYGNGKDDIADHLFIGKSLGAIYGYKNKGIVQEEDKDYLANNKWSMPGDPKFVDLNGDGIITIDNDRTILGYSKENFRMSFSNTINYKNWSLYAMLIGVFGGHNYGMATNAPAFTDISSVWWTAENKNNKYPRPDTKTGRYTPIMGYGFIRLQDLNLAYNFKYPFLRKIGINSLKAFISGKNLFTITNWVGGDPERRETAYLSGGNNSASHTYYPLERSFSFGLNITL